MEKVNYFGKQYDLNWVTGSVIHYSKTPVTQVYGNTYMVSSSTVYDEQIDMLDDKGKRYSFQLKNFNISCLEGDRVTVFWFSGKSLFYFAVLNHELEKYFFDSPLLYRILLAPKASRIVLMLKIAIPFILLGVIVELKPNPSRDTEKLWGALTILYLITVFLWAIFGSTTRAQQNATVKRLNKFKEDFKHTGSILAEPRN